MGLGVWRVWSRCELRGGLLWGNLKERFHLEDLGVDESIILKLILSMSVGRGSGSG
jgi:hypothetical protein